MFFTAFMILPLEMAFAYQAGSDEVLYSVSGINVDKTASSASVARERAMRDAEQRAYGTVLNRISLAADTEELAAPTAEELANMVDGISISGEKTSSVRYIGTLTVTFKPKAVKKFLEAGNVPYINAISSPVLIIPTVKNESLDSFNPDHTSVIVWKSYKDSSPLIPIILPESDGHLKEVITDFLMGKIDIKDVQDAYGVTKVYISNLGENSNDNSITFDMYDAAVGNTQPFKFTVSTNAGMAKAYKAAVDTIIAKLENDFKTDNVVQFSAASYLTAVVPIDNISDWLRVKNKLSDIAVIDRYDLQAMRSDKVQIIIYFGRGVNRLISELAAAKLILEEGSGGIWVLYEKGSKKILSDSADKPTPEVNIYNIDNM